LISLGLAKFEGDLSQVELSVVAGPALGDAAVRWELSHEFHPITSQSSKPTAEKSPHRST